MNPEMLIAADKAKNDQILQPDKDSLRFVREIAHENAAAKIAHVLDQKHDNNGIITVTADKIVSESRVNYFSSGANGELPTGRYLNLARLPRDYTNQLINGSMPYERLMKICSADNYEYHDAPVQDRTGFALVSGYPKHKWIVRSVTDYRRVYDILFYSSIGARARMIAGKPQDSQCDWPLSRSCNGMAALTTFIIPVRRRPENIAFLRVCSNCWERFVAENQISARITSGLVAG
ncbi:hypothetical protein [Mycobacteroides abscessus]|uniref:hypothetical protein n=1 Tax=Mycobacteroides abscessus TaxID=36809 RepID=UPI0011B1F967|nr:hypothetical protein [Mycobacteroides abscessus]